uniref:ATP synthase subunit a n=1 Tax=Branchinella kugenumaensis TaxID=381660 RepID=A0A7S8FJC7_9CRUS|nr:ATP synthase F0 subunit 6 [Branchinella kugenumaensis]QPD06972.1 ATP synthase F0 subunit 6 [Branchinella kugenumaensis]WDW26452.1 ATP synthase F0 subunit 6 [Branchinella kugenumaensis]
MMTNLFSVFDPTSSILTNWLSLLTGMIIIPMGFWAIPSRSQAVWSFVLKKLDQEFSTLLGPSKMGSPILLISLFIFIFYNNFLGLFPYIFTATSHLVVSLCLALPLWLSFILFSWIKETIHALAHLVPLGTPPALMPFMVLIELISNMIRPITLSVRLAANMIAGHLLLTLLGNQGLSANLLTLFMIIMAQVLLLVLEFSVAIIQSYVFATLTTLYASE